MSMRPCTCDCCKERRASPCRECSPLSPEVFRRVRAERDRLRAALVSVVGTDDPDALDVLAQACLQFRLSQDVARAAARALLEVRP